MTLRPQASLIVTLIALVLVAAPARAEILDPPTPKVLVPQEDAASRAYDAAARLAQRKLFQDALNSAETAMHLAPTAQRGALVGAINLALGRHREALEALIIALNLDFDNKRESYVLDKLRQLPPFEPSDFGIVRFQVEPAEVNCTIVGTADTFKVSAEHTVVGLSVGVQRVRCSAAGYEASEISLTVPARMVIVASLRLIPTPPPASKEPVEKSNVPPSVTPPPVERPLPDERKSPSNAGPIVLIVTGGVLVLAGVGADFWAEEASERSQDASRAGDQEAWKSARDDHDLRQNMAYAGYAVGGAVFVSGVIWLIANGSSSHDAVSLTPAFGSSWGVSCHARF